MEKEWIVTSRRIIAGVLAMAGGVAVIAKSEPPTAEEVAALDSAFVVLVGAVSSIIGGVTAIVSRIFPKRSQPSPPPLALLPKALRS